MSKKNSVSALKISKKASSNFSRHLHIYIHKYVFSMSQYLQYVFTSLRNEMVFGVELKSPHSGIQVTSREASMRVTLTVMTPMLVSPQVAQDFSCRLWLWRGTTPSVYSQAMLHTGSDSTTVQIIEVVYEELVGWIVEEFSFRSTCFGGSRNEIYKQWLWSYKHITEWCVLHIFLHIIHWNI